MTTLSTTTPPEIVQDSSEQRLDLLADLKALRPTEGDLPDARLALHRPAILRRLAESLAARIPAGVDRLVAQSGTDAILATAVSLHSGIAFALVDLANPEILGEMHRSERTLLIGFELDANTPGLLAILQASGTAPEMSLHVLETRYSQTASPDLTTHTLFDFTELSHPIQERHHD
ncbi:MULTISPECIES: hypothetical protein [Glutamicibacter]|uniref:hypothetical protein n=1 Tax=Glutamicibacter TaxID=1742989 RepID=UPI003FB8E12D